MDKLRSNFQTFFQRNTEEVKQAEKSHEKGVSSKIKRSLTSFVNNLSKRIEDRVNSAPKTLKRAVTLDLKKMIGKGVEHTKKIGKITLKPAKKPEFNPVSPMKALSDDNKTLMENVFKRKKARDLIENTKNNTGEKFVDNFGSVDKERTLREANQRWEKKEEAPLSEEANGKKASTPKTPKKSVSIGTESQVHVWKPGDDIEQKSPGIVIETNTADRTMTNREIKGNAGISLRAEGENVKEKIKDKLGEEVSSKTLLKSVQLIDLNNKLDSKDIVLSHDQFRNAVSNSLKDDFNTQSKVLGSKLAIDKIEREPASTLVSSHLSDLIKDISKGQTISAEDLKSNLKEMFLKSAAVSSEEMDYETFHLLVANRDIQPPPAELKNAPEYKKALADYTNGVWDMAEERTFNLTPFTDKEISTKINQFIDNLFERNDFKNCLSHMITQRGATLE